MERRRPSCTRPSARLCAGAMADEGLEDGDSKGFQSSKGVKAKKEEKIESWKLSPHTPGMIDYSLWNEIEGRTLAKRAYENESLTSYKKRLCITAKRLPKSLVKNVLAIYK